jgi:LacI family transcriptional regulator
MLIRPSLDQETVAEWVKRFRPDAVLGGLPLAWLRATRLAIPREMGYADLNFDASMGDIAGVDQNPPAIGAAAVDLTVEQLYHNECGLPAIPKVVLIEGKWQPGGTVRGVVGPE